MPQRLCRLMCPKCGAEMRFVTMFIGGVLTNEIFLYQCPDCKEIDVRGY